MLVGFVINPVAGMGGSVALKGTDGESYELALVRGAVPLARGRAVRALSAVSGNIRYLTAPGEMGAGALSDLGLGFEVVAMIDEPSGPDDTRRACLAFLDAGADLIVFCGGDGTARDVLDVVGERVPVIGIPSGVKMHSAVFANTPEEAGSMISLFASGMKETKLAEVMDVDEDAFRRGELRARLYGYMRVPSGNGMQPPKGSVYATSDEEQKEAIAEYVVEEMLPGTLYILGPGTTTKAVADRMQEGKTLLGVDVYLDRRLLKVDAAEDDLLELLKEHRARLLLTPIGRQGFVLGRGNQQISPRVVEAVGPENILVLATPEKLRETPCLRYDTGDAVLDREMSGFQRVLVGYAQYRMVRCGRPANHFQPEER
ncbi:MAG: ATP-NAD kinase [Methanomassiliicoccales archaeon PtaB.Bin134]|nr:MAG: ATP-NAD kinase [Methanomassiliicoccales archaeon PtaB.Bin134]